MATRSARQAGGGALVREYAEEARWQAAYSSGNGKKTRVSTANSGAREEGIRTGQRGLREGAGVSWHCQLLRRYIKEEEGRQQKPAQNVTAAWRLTAWKVNGRMSPLRE